MHPVNYLFEDIYRNDWNVRTAANKVRRRGEAGPWVRDLRFLVSRKRGRSTIFSHPWIGSIQRQGG